MTPVVLPCPLPLEEYVMKSASPIFAVNVGESQTPFDQR